MSLEDTTSPEQGDQVSGLLQNLQRMAHPCGTQHKHGSSPRSRLRLHATIKPQISASYPCAMAIPNSIEAVFSVMRLLDAAYGLGQGKGGHQLWLLRHGVCSEA